MAFRFLHSAPRPLLISLPLGLSISLPLLVPNPSSVIRCDSGPTLSQPSHQSWSYRSQSAETHSVRSACSGGLSASTARQISLGSVLGLLAGVGLRIFSRPLAFSVGLLILAVEWAASKGYNIVPVRWIQRNVKSVNVRRALLENVPFKASFGSTLLLAAFTNFDAPQK